MREREGEGEESGASEREKVWVSLCVSVSARVRELPAPVSSLPAHGVMSHVQGSRWPCALWAASPDGLARSGHHHMWWFVGVDARSEGEKVL